MIFLSIPFVILAWMMGGQFDKWIRPVGVALSIFCVYAAFNLHTWYYGLPALLYGGELTMGYGVNSWWDKIAKGSDELTRIYYSLFCCIPVLVTCILLRHWWQIGGILLILGAFQIRSVFGKTTWGKIGKYDILPVDFFRSLAIGVAMSWALI